MRLVVCVLAAAFLGAAFGFRAPVSRVSRGMQLGARKHQARKYGDFLDGLPLPNKYADKMDGLVEQMDLEDTIEEEQRTSVLGDALRRERTRNLEEVAKMDSWADDPMVSYRTNIPKEKNWSDYAIALCIESLNRSFGISTGIELIDGGLFVAEEEDGEDDEDEKEEEDLEFSPGQLLGIIDWFEFDIHARDLMPEWTSEGERGEQVRNNVKGWIEFHTKKKDARFEDGIWKWDPEGR